MRMEEGLELARLVAREVATGRVTREEAERYLAETFRPDCPACHENYELAIARLYAPPPLGLPTGSRLGGRVAAFLAAHPAPAKANAEPRPAPRRPRKSRALPAEELLARSLAAFERLRAEPWVRRRERVQLEWRRFRGLEIARLCLAEAFAALPGNPEDSDHWAELALFSLAGKRRVAGAAPAEVNARRLEARLLQANAARCRGDLDEAAEDLAFIVASGTELDLRDFAFWVGAKHFLASTERDLRQFGPAVQQARAAAALARAAGFQKNEVQARSQLGSIFEQQADFASALVAIRHAVPLLAGLQDPVLEFGVRHNESLYLARLRRFSEAEEIARALAPRYESQPSSRNHRGWLSALIHAGLGRPAEAEIDFQAARDGFLAAKNPYDAALVTLDWALFLLDQDRAEEVLPLAVSMGQAFEALGVARETMASWAIFQAAAERRELDRAVAAELVRRVGEERGGGRKAPVAGSEVSR